MENRSSEISDRKLPISERVRHGFFIPIGNRQFPIGKNDSVRNGLIFYNEQEETDKRVKKSESLLRQEGRTILQSSNFNFLNVYLDRYISKISRK